MKWGLSVLDWRSHAIDERADHPTGVFKAECGHLLLMVVPLHDEPDGPPCRHCSASQTPTRDGGEVVGYFIGGGCGHRRLLVDRGGLYVVDRCDEDCEASVT